MSKDIENLVKQFVVDMEHVIRERTMETIEITLGQKVTDGLKLKAKAPGTPATKRSPDEMDLAKKKILDLLRRVPGQSSEQIQRALRRDGSQLALPLKQLLEAKTLRSEGVARGRKYWLR